MSGRVVSKERADSALLSMVSPRDYETWKNIGISYKAAGGDVDTFLRWSSSDPDNYDEAQARRLFEHVSENGRITAGTLFWHAKRAGWVEDASDSSVIQAPSAAQPSAMDLSPVQQAVAQLVALFEPGEYVNLSVRANWSEKRCKWEPTDGGTCYERDDLIARLQSEGFGGVLDGYEPEAGIWVCQNPTNGAGRGKGRTTAWRHALIESDEIPVDEQIRIMSELDLPITALTKSGGKSVHALVRVEADGPNHYEDRVRLLHELCDAAGLKVDAANKDASRLTRLAGASRGTERQSLLGTDMGARDFHSWAEAHRPHAGDQDAEESKDVAARFENLFIPMPSELQELPSVLIENTFQKQGIMLVGAAPRVGKTFLTAQMVVAFATGTGLLGFEFTQCERILVVNSEMNQAEYVNRIVEASLASGIAADVASHVRIAHTDYSPEMTVKDIAEVVCGSGYRPDVVIIDPIYPLFAGDENSNADARTTFGYLKMIASKTGAGVIYMHHFSKGPQDLKEARDRVSGAGTLGRNYSAMWSLTELAPSEEDVADLPDGAVVVRVSTDLRSFKKSKANKNLDFNAVRIDGMFLRDDNGKFDKAPTREAARRAEASKKTAQKEKRKEKARKRIKDLLDKNGGEPVPFSTVQNVTALSPNTIKDYLIDFDEYQLVKMQMDGKGQKRNHIAWTAWRPPLGTDLLEVGGADE